MKGICCSTTQVAENTPGGTVINRIHVQDPDNLDAPGSDTFTCDVISNQNGWFTVDEDLNLLVRSLVPIDIVLYHML